MRYLDRSDVLGIYSAIVRTRAAILCVELSRRRSLILDDRRDSRRVFLEAPMECRSKLLMSPC